MPLNYSARRILAEGLEMATRHNCPPDMIGRLRGALSYEEATGVVLRDALLGRKAPSPTWIESIASAPDLAAVQDE